MPIRSLGAPRAAGLWLRAGVVVLRAAAGLLLSALAHPGAELRVCRQTGRVSVR